MAFGAATKGFVVSKLAKFEPTKTTNNNDKHIKYIF
jgi:hypothetical protein